MRLVAIAAFATVLAASGAASAADFTVSAFDNSSTAGVALPSLSLTTGETFTVSSSLDDLWSAGGRPRYSDANGLTYDRYATATDDSGWTPGVQIGADFGLWTQHGLSVPYGTLVGEIGGVFQALGANVTTTAWNTGTLNLYYWDENNYDNFGSIKFNISAASGAPEAATWAMMIGGFGLAGALMRRRRAVVA